MEFIILFIAVVIGFVIGWEARERHAMRVVESILQEAEEQAKEEPSAERMRLERHSGVIYAYTTEDEFIGQGSSLDELDTAIQKRFPGRKFLLKKENLEQIGVSHEHL